MTQTTFKEVETLFLRLPRKDRVLLFARFIQEAPPDEEILEDFEDILFIQRHKSYDEELVSWEQVEENLWAKRVL